MKAYLDIVEKILEKGVLCENRTGVDALVYPGRFLFEHDMAGGFPFLTTKKMFLRRATVELEFFIKGITDKKWLQDRKNRFWNEWASPSKVPYGHDEETKQRMMEERDLGPIYGFQWRHFGAEYRGYDVDYAGEGKDQLAGIVETVKKNPNDRGMIVNAWNANDLEKMALRPCHYGFQIDVIAGRLNLGWDQRSVDTMLGLPYNIAVYGLLLELLARESGFEPGILSGYLFNTHIYVNHVDGAKEQLKRDPKPLPSLEIENFTSVFDFDWEKSGVKLKDYNPHPSIKFEIAV